MRDYSTKSEQIRKLRETRALAAEQLERDREIAAKRDAKATAVTSKNDK